jgi:hypothetical protein
MPHRIARFVVAAVALAAASAARANTSLNLEGFGGWQDLRLSTQSVGNAVGGREGTGIVGGDLVLNLSGLGLGVLVDKTVSGSFGRPWAGAILAGLLLDVLPSLRIEAMGEVGRRGRDFGNIFDSDGATFVGVRPGVSVRLLPTMLRVGLTGIVRWPTSNGDFGSPDYGIVGKVGIELP